MLRNQKVTPVESSDELTVGSYYYILMRNGNENKETIGQIVDIKLADFQEAAMLVPRAYSITSNTTKTTNSASISPCSSADDGPHRSIFDSVDHNDLKENMRNGQIVNNNIKTFDNEIIKNEYKEDLSDSILDERMDTSSETDVKSDFSDVKTQKKYVYYVHYHGQDRRLDEWVDRSRFLKHIHVSPGTDPFVISTPDLKNEKEFFAGTLTRQQKLYQQEFCHVQKSFNDLDATTALLEREHTERTKVRNVEIIRLGNYKMDTWYFSPYPSELCYNHQLFICEYCFAYFNNSPFYKYHMKNECSYRQPPGDEIYRDGNLSLYEVDGKYNKRYCQYLCLLSKLFLDHKTLYFDVEHFLFYILCEVDDYGAHIVGHFSKERASMNNLACIIVFPPYQRKGYGQFLIQVSYALSSREGFIGTPEKPLSDMGKVSYRSYWWWILLKALDHASLEHVPLHELSLTTGIHEEDIMTTLQPMNLLKPWNGITFVRCGKKYIEHLKTLNLTRPPKLLLQVELLRWLPKIRRDGF